MKNSLFSFQLILFIPLTLGVLSNPPFQAHLSSSSSSLPNPFQCQVTFLRYTPSPLEQKWIDNVEIWQDDDVCKHISDIEMMDWLGNVSYVINNTQESVVVTRDDKIPQKQWKNVLSVFTYQQLCLPHRPLTKSASNAGGDGDSSHKYIRSFIHIPIEPTAAIARDPRKCWEQMTEKYTQSKEYLIPLTSIAFAALKGYHLPSQQAHKLPTSSTSSSSSSSSHPSSSHNQTKPQIKYFLFDAGASIIASYNWDGTDWIYKWYDKVGIKFTEVHAWEPKKLNSDWTRLNIYPPLKEVLHFYPIGVNNIQNDFNNNPINKIKLLTTSDDFVVFKLDIDSPVEIEITKQVIQNKNLTHLLSDFYFEHHVRNPVMRMHGLGKATSKENDLASWYRMVIPARRNGLRMHFWP